MAAHATKQRKMSADTRRMSARLLDRLRLIQPEYPCLALTPDRHVQSVKSNIPSAKSQLILGKKSLFDAVPLLEPFFKVAAHFLMFALNKPEKSNAKKP